MAHTRNVVGPVYGIADCVLRHYPEYAAYRRGACTREQFGAFLNRVAPHLCRAGLPPDDVHFAKRYPRSMAGFVSSTLRMLVARGLLTGATYDVAAYEAAAARARSSYDHGPLRTYIYPEEARLLFAVADILRPSSIVVLGSYYGYWAYWAIAAVAPHGGRAVLVDPDRRVQALAARNFAHLGLASVVEHVTTTGQAYLASARQRFDCVILDAEGARTHADLEQRGKAIYAPLLRAVLRTVTPGAHLICHNILLQDIAACAFFNGVVERNRRELSAFLSLVQGACDSFVECTSTEGIGMGRFRSDL